MRITSTAFAASIALAVSPVLAQDESHDEPLPGTDEPTLTVPPAAADDEPAPDPQGTQAQGEQAQDAAVQDEQARDLAAPDEDEQTAAPVVVPPIVVDVDDDDEQAAREQDEAGLLRAGEVVALQIGAGQGDFAGAESRDATEWGATYEARAILGRNSPLGLEAAYVGSARGIEGFGVDEDAGIMSNGVEGALRVAVPLSLADFHLAPFLSGGMGWEHYTLVGEGDATSGIENDDSLLTVPLAVGLEAGYAAFMASARATYKHGFDAEMFGESSSFDEENMNTWNVGVGVGLVF